MRRRLSGVGAATAGKSGWRAAAIVILALAAGLAGRAGAAFAAARPALPPARNPASPLGEAALPAVTIQAEKDRRELRRRVDHFVTSVIVRRWGGTLLRWNEPVCPLVAGMTPQDDEFILRRVVRAGTAAHVHLGATGCTPNLYVIASHHPDQLLQSMWARNPRMYSSLHGLGAVKRYLHSSRPVRAWYNTRQTCRSGPANASESALIGTSLQTFMLSSSGVPFCSGMHSFVSHEGLRSIDSVVIVADMTRMDGVTIGQLADYVAMVGLAGIHQDAALASLPTILRLFQDRKHPPMTMTAWDRALLYSLYNTSQSSTMQMSAIEATVMNRISPQ